jgi:DNA-binding response OmpR family regulator
MATGNQFKELGVVAILEKPFNPEQLLATLEASFKHVNNQPPQ